MNKIIPMILIGYANMPSAWADSLLTAQQFPKTFEDLSFKSRIDVLSEGYAPFEIEYDENGVCISGCAYPGITIKEDMRAVDEATEQMANLIAAANQEQQQTSQSGQSQQQNHPAQPNQPGEPVQPNTPTQNYSATDWCHNGLSTTLPLRYPVNMANFKYKLTSDFGFRTSSPNGARFHPALDIGCPIGTPVYATADGVVASVSNQTSAGGAGLFINIKHSNGLITQYLHLSQALVKKGDNVRACQEIAKSGNSGVSKQGTSYGAHLDYRIRFDTNSNNYIDILCPCKIGNRSNNTSGNNTLNMSCAHSLFNAPYKFTKYNPNSDDTKRSLWRVKHGHCMSNVNDLLPDEVR